MEPNNTLKDSQTGIERSSDGVKLTNSTPESPRATLQRSVENLISDLNTKRKEDTQILSNFKNELTTQVQSTLNAVETSLYDLYDQQTSIVQSKLNELYSTFDRITKLEKWHEQYRSALHLLSDEGGEAKEPENQL